MGGGGGDRHDHGTAVRDAEATLSEVLTARDRARLDLANTWQVNPSPDSRWATPFGDTWAEPPLYTVAQRAVTDEAPAEERFVQDGTDYLVRGRPLGDGTAVVMASTSPTWPPGSWGSVAGRRPGAPLAVGAVVAVAWWSADDRCGPHVGCSSSSATSWPTPPTRCAPRWPSSRHRRQGLPP